MVTLLIVEDEHTHAMLMSRWFQRMGYRVMIAATAQAAREQLAKQHPDLIIMDIMLPGEDGWSMTEQLKDDPATANIPVIALTARGMSTEIARSNAAGCAAHLTKPIDFWGLQTQVARLLTPPKERALAG